METLQLLTIIAEDTLAPILEREIEQLGAKGYTAWTVTGKSLDQVRDNLWEGENVKIETIVSESICQKILQRLQEKYFDRHALIAFYHPISVVRTQHFM